MRNALDSSSSADEQATDELFSRNTIDDVMTISGMTDIPNRLPEQSITAESISALRKTFGGQPRRMQKSHAEHMGRPEFLEVRSLLSSNPIEARDRAAVTLDESREAVTERQQEFDILQVGLADLQDRLTIETDTVKELESALQAAKDQTLLHEAQLVQARLSVRTSTTAQSVARTALLSAERSLWSTVVTLKAWQKNLEKALTSTLLVQRLQTDITSARQRIESAKETETEAADRLQENPTDVTLQRAYLLAQRNCARVKVTEERKILTLETRLQLATVQAEKDIPLVESTRKSEADAKTAVATATTSRDAKLAAVAAATEARAAATRDVARLPAVITEAHARTGQAQRALEQGQIRVRTLQSDIETTETDVDNAKTTLAQAKNAYHLALDNFRRTQGEVDALEAEILLRQIDEINENIALLEREQDRADEIAILKTEREQLKEHPAYIIHAANIDLGRIDALTQSWNTEDQENRMLRLTERGTLLQATAAELIELSAKTEELLDTAVGYAKMSLEGLSERMQTVALSVGTSINEWAEEREELLRPQSAIDTLDSEQLSRAPRLFASFRKLSEGAHMLDLTLRSPYDQTYIELEDRTNQGLRISGETISHVGGTTNVLWSKMFERMTNGRGGEIFVRMYTDSSKSLLLDTVSGQYNPDSNVGSVEVQSGFETMGAKAVLALPELGGTAALRSWQGMQSGVPSMTTTDGGFMSHGSGFSLDLRGAEHLVTNVSFTVTSENADAPVTVRFYRGTELVGIQTVASGSIVDVMDTEGITSMLIANAMREMSPRARQFLDYFHTADGQFWERGNPGGAAVRFFYNNTGIPQAERSAIVAEASAGFLPYDLTISDLEIAGNAYQPQIDAEPPSISNNPDLGRSAHPYWGQSEDTLRRGSSPGYLATGRFGPSAYGIRRDINQYSAVRIMGTNGIAKINYVAYHSQASDTRLSPEYYEIFGNTVILKPGAPEQVVIYFDKEGGGVQGLNIDVEHRESMTREEILPPEGMSVRTNILAIRNPNAGEGVGPALTEIKDLGRPVTIGQGNVLMNVWNDGQRGGTVRVITNPNTAGAREVSFTLGAGEGKSVAIIFTVPESGALVIHTILPDGTTITDGKTLKTEGDSSDNERRIAIKQGNGTYLLLWVALNDPRPTVSDAPEYDPGFAAWKQAYMQRTSDPSVADPENFDKVFVTYLETKKKEPLTEVQEKFDKFIDEHGDILTVLNRASLTRILETAIRGLASAITRGHQAQIDHFTRLKEAAEGLLNDMEDPRADEWKTYIERTTSDPELAHLDYTTITSANPKNTTERLRVDRMAGGSISFRLTEKMMVNFSVDMRNVGLISGQSMPILPNISLQLIGRRDSGEIIDWDSDKNRNSGESVSAMLDAGTYTLRIQDKTSYPDTRYMTASQRMKLHLPVIPVAVEINPYNSANIEGKISIEGSAKVMPVKMSVAEFDDATGKRKTDYKNVSELKTDKPVWVVVHGMDSSERTDIMVELAKALKKYPDMQVVTVNWENAAADGIPTRDAKWTPAVGQWIARQLLNLGFSPQDIELKAWSHGSYVAQAVAEEVFNITKGQKVGSLVALDPAGNWPLLSGFNHKIIDFKKYADYSLAIEGSWIAGSDALAATADTYIKLNSLNTSATQISDNHTSPVTLMASLLDYNRIVGGKQMDFIALDKIMNPAHRPEEKGYSEDRYSGGADFVVDVHVEERIVFKDGTYYTYPYAFPFKMHYFDTEGVEKEIAFDGTPE